VRSDAGPSLLIAILIAGNKVWLYVTILTVGYMISRGFAKSGVRDSYWAERGDRDASH
jgi:hypothetical protein